MNHQNTGKIEALLADEHDAVDVTDVETPAPGRGQEAMYESSFVPSELPHEVRAQSAELTDAGPIVMSDGTRLGLRVLLAALAAGVVGNVLRETPWGLNVLLWVGAVTGAALVLARRHRPQALGEGKWLAVPVIFFASCFAWRDSGTLNLIAALALLIAAVLALFRTNRGRLAVAGLAEYLETGMFATLYSLFGGLALISNDVKWREVPRKGWSRHSMAVARGLLLVVPLLLVFGGLLAAADGFFENVMARMFSFDASRAVLHVTLTLFIAALAAGYLRSLLVAELPEAFRGKRLPFPRLLSRPPQYLPRGAPGDHRRSAADDAQPPQADRRRGG